MAAKGLKVLSLVKNLQQVQGRIMRIPRRWITIFLFTAISLCASPMFVSAQSAAPRTMLHGSVLPAAALSTDQGLLPATTKIPDLQIYLRPGAAQQIALAQLIADQHSSDSPLYHHWITPREFGEQFGVSSANEVKIRSWLTQQGFTNIALSSSRTVVTFRGTAAQVAAAFRSPLHRVSWHGAAHYSNLTNITIPQDIAPLIQSVRGLNDFHLQPQSVKVNTKHVRTDFTSTGYNGVYGLAPGDIATIYDLNPLYDEGIDGTGMSAVVVGASDLDLSDIDAYRSAFNLPANTPSLVLIPTSTDPGTVDPLEVEADIDLELLGAVAPNAHLIYVYGTDVIAALEYAVDQDLAPVISMSYGGCEYYGETWDSQMSSIQLVAQQASAEGISILVASGDTGAAGCDSQGSKAAVGGEMVDFPADVPEITGVGGTSLTPDFASYFGSFNNSFGGSATGYIPEVAWNSTDVGLNLQASGGGSSILFSKPGWQQGPGVPADGQRDVPDVAMFSLNAGMAYVICSLGDCASGYPNLMTSGAAWGGTSASTPVFAGIVTLLNQYLVANHKIATPGLGSLNPNLYLLANKTTDVFHDITQGNNVVPCAAGSPDCTSGSFGYTAGTGYDEVTGLGSVDGLNLINEWSDHSVKSTTLQLTSSESPVVNQSSDTVTLTATVTAPGGTDIPTGSVTFYQSWTLGSDLAISMGTVPLDSNGTATLDFSNLNYVVGTLYAVYSGSVEYAESVGSLPVLNTTYTTLTYSPPGNITVGSNVVLTASVSITSPGRPTGTVAFTANGAPLGTATLAVSASGTTSASVSTSSLPVGTDIIRASYSGDSLDVPSTTETSLTINQKNTITSLSINPTGTLTPGEHFTLTAAITCAGTPIHSGNVKFSIGTASYVVLVNPANGIATWSGTAQASDNGVGLSASYQGTPTYAPSSANAGALSVKPFPTSTSLAVSPSGGSLQAGSSYTLTATVAAPSGSPTPSGSVVFTAGSATHTAILNQAGVATWTTTAPGTTGSFTVSAAYSGTSDFAASTSPVLTESVTAVPTSTSLTASVSTVTAGSPVILTATVTPTAGTGFSLAGEVTFTAGNLVLGSSPLGNGSASLTTSSLPIGSDSVTASFVGGTNGAFAGSTSDPVTVIVNPAAKPVPTIQSLSPAFTPAGSAAFTLTVAGTNFASGTTVYWGKNALTTTVVSATQLTAQVPASDVATAGHTAITVQASDSGAGTSNSLQFEVDSSDGSTGTPVFPSSTATVASGSAASFDVTLPSGAANVSASCLNLPSGSTCSYSASNSTLTVTTAGSTPAGSYPITVVFSETLPASSAGFLAPFLLLPFWRQRKRSGSPRAKRVRLALGLIAALAVLAGCGGGSTAPAPTQPVTPSTYQVTSSAVVNLTVQ